MLKISIREARGNAGMTQEEAAKALGIGVCTLARWESNPEAISAIKQRSLSETYGIPIDNLIFLPNS